MITHQDEGNTTGLCSQGVIGHGRPSEMWLKQSLLTIFNVCVSTVVEEVARW